MRLPQAAALIYGVYSADNDTPSHRAFGGGEYVLSTASMIWFWEHYVPQVDRRDDPLASPLQADLGGMPPLYVSAAELDPLRDDSERLAGKLALAGVDFDYRLWRGVCHACLMMSRMLPAADAQIAEIAAFSAARSEPPALRPPEARRSHSPVMAAGDTPRRRAYLAMLTAPREWR